MDKDLRIAALEAQNARLVERVADLEKVLLNEDFLPPLKWKLTVAEQRIFTALASRDLATKEYLMVALYDDTLKDRAEIKIVDVFVCKLRKKLKLFDVSIETVWGRGYRLLEREQFRRSA